MEQERFRRIRNQPDTDFTQDAAGHVRSVDEEEGSDLPRVGQSVWTVADNFQTPGSKIGNNR